MSTERKLTANGKPMRALRALEKTDEAQPLTEYGVYLVARRGIRDSTAWHGALGTLVARGLAKRGGRVGGYEWWITNAGKALLASQS